MPGRDGTGPLGQGPMTGRGFGVYAGNFAANGGTGYGRGLGCGFGRGAGCGRGSGLGRRRGFGFPGAAQDYGLTDEAILNEEKEFLQRRLDAVSKQLAGLKKDET